MTLLNKVLSAVRREQMLPPNASVTVGVSGGADSVALLHALLALQNELALCEVRALHINHCLRGDESQRDQQFVERLCEQWKVPLSVHRCDIAAIAAKEHRGLEETGRMERYRLFEAEASAADNRRIATAHSASDNAETVLLHLCRGTGLHGLCGIPPVRGFVIRPLIDCTREEIEAYCRENNIAYVTDSTNADWQYARNRIRHRVMPELKAINPQAERAIGRLIARAREQEKYTEQQICCALQEAQVSGGCYSRAALRSLPVSLQGEVLRHLLSEQGEQRGSEQHIAEAARLLVQGGRLSLSCERELVVQGNFVFLQHKQTVLPFCFQDVSPESEWAIGGETWCLRRISRYEYEQKLNNSQFLFSNACDYDKLHGSLCLRQRQAGDAFHPAGRGCGKTLKKLLNEAAVPAMRRDAVPVLCDENGIALVAGLGCDERVRIQASTETVLLLIRTEDV